MNFKLSKILLSTLLFSSISGHAVEWSTSNLQYRWGDQYNDNGANGGEKFAKHAVQVSNTSGYDFGKSYIFATYYKSDKNDDYSSDLYMEGTLWFSLSKILNEKLSFGPVKDVSLALGINLGEKENAYNANTRSYLAGIDFDLNVPDFSYFGLTLWAYHNNGYFTGYGGGDFCEGHGTTYQITPYWARPFNIGNSKFVFDGYIDVIGSNGSCHTQYLTETQIKLDVGNYWGKPNTFHVGVEYQYWKNKFGTKDLDERVPQIVLQWTR